MSESVTFACPSSFRQLGLAFGRVGFSRIGGPIIGRDIPYISQSQPTIRGSHYFHVAAVSDFLFDIRCFTVMLANGGCAAEGCRINS